MKKKVVSILMSAMLTVPVFAGCASSEPPEMPVYNTTETFRIGNWGVPPHENTGYMEYANNPNYCTEENWTAFRDCGYNIAVPTSGPDRDDIIRDLEMADKVGMKVLVRDQSAAGFETIIRYAQEKGFGYEETRAELDKRAAGIQANIDEYKKHASFQGVNAYDEPSMDYYEPIAACQDWFLKHYPEYEFYANLLPVYATPRQLYGKRSNESLSYPDYVSEFRNIVNPSSLCYDHYPILEDFDGSAYVKDDFLYNLNVFAKEAQKAKVPVYVYIQTMGFFTNLPITSYSEFAWQCYTSLAFGVKGLLTFQYWTQLQAEYHNNVRDGIVDRDGTKTPIYDEVQKVFKEITDMQDIYLHYNWDGVKTVEGGRIVNDSFSLVTDQLDEFALVNNVETDEDLVVGQFSDDDGGYAYMVTNATEPFDPVTAHVSLTLRKGYDYAMVVKKGVRSMVKLDKNALTLEIDSGEGCFVVPVK